MFKKHFLLLLFSLLLFQLSFSQEALTPLTPYDVAMLKSASGAQISEDGKHLLYFQSVPADPFKENKPAASHMHLYEAASGKDIAFVTQDNPRAAAFRPGHASITFLSKREGDKNTSLYEIPLTGGEAGRLFIFETSISSYQWSPDGMKLAFIAPEPKGKSAHTLPYKPEIYEEELTNRLGYVTDLTQEIPDRIQLEGCFYTLQWSPDGKKLAAAVAPTPLVDDRYMKQRIHVVDASSLEKTGEVDHTAKLGQFAWSPDGSKIAILAGAHINDPTPGRLLIVGGNGGKPVNLKPKFPGKFEDIQWAGKDKLYYLASKGVWSEFGTISSDGKNMDLLIASGQQPVLSRFHAAKNGVVAFSGSSPKHPGEIFLTVNDEKPKRITNSNPWLSEKKFGKQEVIKYKARDGLEIEGLLIRPVDEVPGKKYPLITCVHGGPESHLDNSWVTRYAYAGQVGAGQGYAVFYPNYRGSTGRGIEYTMSSQADPAGKEFDDIVDGVDYLIGTGLVDEEKVGVNGGSYGGYATGWMATRYSDRFAAGVMFVGISDKLSKWGTTDIAEEEFHVHARHRVWEDFEFWLKRSPIYYAGQAETPLLIMHGKEDPRVHPGQSMELYRHIKTRTDTPVRLVFYPGEGHGNRNSTARLDFNLRMMRWYDKYLKGKDVGLDSELIINKP